MSALEADSGPAEEPSQPQDTPERPRRRWRKIALLLLLLAAVVGVGIAIWLEVRGGSITEVIPGISRPGDLPAYDYSIYGATRPLGVAVSGDGERIYVTESDGARLVRVYDRSSGKEVGTLKPPKATGASHVPVYVAVDPETDDVYVSDRMQQTVYVYDAKGAYRNEFKPSRAEIGGGWQPLGLAFDGQGNLYVTDVSGPVNRVLAFRRDGTLLRTLGSPGEFSFPNAIAIDRWDNVYVSDSNNGRVAIFDPAGKLVASINRGAGAGDLGLPRGILIDGDDRLYVVDTTAQIVQVYHLEKATPPKYIGSFGEEGQFEGGFAFPNGIAMDPDSRIYVTDRENNRVQVWSY